MAETIWKFQLAGRGGNAFSASIPRGGRVLSAGWQGHDFVVWAAVDPSEPREERFFHIAGTGHPLPPGVMYSPLLGRVEVSAPSGLYIFHVFDTCDCRISDEPPSPTERVEPRP